MNLSNQDFSFQENFENNKDNNNDNQNNMENNRQLEIENINKN